MKEFILRPSSENQRGKSLFDDLTYDLFKETLTDLLTWYNFGRNGFTKLSTIAKEEFNPGDITNSTMGKIAEDVLDIKLSDYKVDYFIDFARLYSVDDLLNRNVFTCNGITVEESVHHIPAWIGWLNKFEKDLITDPLKKKEELIRLSKNDLAYWNGNKLHDICEEAIKLADSMIE